MDHLEERAELFALGMLADDERADVEAHVQTCDPCAQRLGRAESAVAAMVGATHAQATAPRSLRERIPGAARVAVPPASLTPRRRSASAWTGAAAAVFALAAGSLAVQNVALRSDIGVDTGAFSDMLHSHFSHMPFLSPAGSPITAKLIYDRTGGWYEILATGVAQDTRVVVVRGTVVTELSVRFARRGSVWTLALPPVGRVDELRLLDARGHRIAQVRPMMSNDAAPAPTPSPNRKPR